MVHRCRADCAFNTAQDSCVIVDNTHATFEDCTFSNGLDTGVKVEVVSKVYLEGCQVSGNRESDVFMSSQSSKVWADNGGSFEVAAPGGNKIQPLSSMSAAEGEQRLSLSDKSFTRLQDVRACMLDVHWWLERLTVLEPLSP